MVEQVPVVLAMYDSYNQNQKLKKFHLSISKVFDALISGFILRLLSNRCEKTASMMSVHNHESFRKSTFDFYLLDFEAEIKIDPDWQSKDIEEV